MDHTTTKTTDTTSGDSLTNGNVANALNRIHIANIKADSAKIDIGMLWDNQHPERVKKAIEKLKTARGEIGVAIEILEGKHD